MSNENEPHDPEDDEAWAEFLSPGRRELILRTAILVHPNTEDPRADHLHDALWVNRSQPVNAYDMRKPGPGEPPIEQIFANARPSVKIESA
jgi:aromatic ring-cleaving dioxygenase